jgi:hypothetical protein
MAEKNLCCFCGKDHGKLASSNKEPTLFSGYTVYDILYNSSFDAIRTYTGKGKLFVTKKQLQECLKMVRLPTNWLPKFRIVNEADPRNCDYYLKASVYICASCLNGAYKFLRKEFLDYSQRFDVIYQPVLDVHQRLKEKCLLRRLKKLPERDDLDYFCWFSLKPKEQTLFYRVGLSLAELLSLGFVIRYRIEIKPEDFERFVNKFDNLPADQQLVGKQISISPRLKGELIKELSQNMIFTDRNTHPELIQRFLKCRAVISDSAIHQFMAEWVDSNPGERGQWGC